MSPGGVWNLSWEENNRLDGRRIYTLPTSQEHERLNVCGSIMSL